jgi:tRNA(Ile)-lysidine synthase
MISINSFLIHFNTLCPNYKKGVLVAVSGGADSICLLHLFHQLNIYVEAAHINYGLRAEDSDMDMELVTQTCKIWEIPLHVKKVNSGELEQISNNIQEAARILRYEYFNQIIQQTQLDYIATAHHSDDQAETVLFNIIRGKFKLGLSGIPATNENIVRPLLIYSKKEIVAHLENNKVAYRTDQSNFTNDYTRNEIRNTILPLLEKINPKVSTHLNHLAEHAQFANFAIDEFMAHESNKFVVDLAENRLNIYPEKINCPKMFKPHIFYHLLQSFGFNFSQCISIADANSHTSGSIFETAHYVLYKHDDYYRLQGRNVNNSSVNTTIKSFPNEINCGGKRYSLDIVAWSNQFDLRKIDGWCVQIDWGDEVIVTNIEAGDKMIPLGMKGFKKISDILIDNKVPLFEKPTVKKILINNQVAAIIPVGIDERYKVTDTTKLVLSIKPLPDIQH